MPERYYEDELKAFCFVEVDGGVCVTGYSGMKERVIIPASLDGKPVTALGVSEEGFTDDMLLDVQIPASVRHVDVRAINSPPVYGWFGVEMEYEDGWVAAFSLAPGNEHLAIIDGMLIEDGKTVVYCRDTEAKTITIPEGIEMIGEYAFRDCTALQKVVLPASLRIIEAHAFEKCGLREVTLPDGLEKIGRCAFRDVLLRISPAVNGLEACEGVALRGMAGHPHFCVRGDLLLSADGKTAVWYLGDGGSELAVPEGVEEIAPYAFARSALSGVKKLTLPSTLRRIGAGAFGENRVKTLRFPENLTDVEDTAFRFSGVTSVLVAKNNPGFRTDKTALYRVHADGSLALLFCFRAKIEEYAVLEGTVRILDGAFADCGQLEQLVLPETLKEFSENCLGRGARKIVVPASVEKLVFRQDDSGVDYEIAAGNPVYFWKDHILYESGADGLRAVRFDGAAKDVALAEGTVSVAPRAFRRRLQSVSFPNSLRRVEHHAFCACGLQSVSLNEGLETIGDAAFASNEIAEVSLPASVTDLSRSAFEECPLRFYRVAEGSASYASPDGALYNLEQTILYDVPVKMAVGTFRVPDTVTEIGRAFHGCTDIREIVFPESVRQFWLKSIVGCEQLRDVWFGDDVEYISESCIDYDFPIALHAEPDSPVANMIEQLRGIVKGRMQLRLIAGGEEDVRNLSADFDLEMNDTGLTILKNRCEKAEVVVPAEIGGRAVTQISAYAFSGSDSRNVQLERVELPDSVKEIGEGVFESCRKLRHVRLPKGITKLPKKLFQYCTSLAELEIPEGVASVEESVFFGCEDLQTLVFPESAVSISEWLFSDGEDSMDNERYKDLYLNPKTIYYAPGGSFADQFLKAYQPNHYSVKKLTVMNGTPADENLTAAERESLECLDVSVSEDGTVSVSIKRDLKDPPPVVTIPSAIGGMPVTCLTGLSSLNSEIERLRIPASVESVEGLNELSFYIGGNRLRGVDVAEGNPHYWSDGQALYTKDRSVLIHMFDYHAQEYTLCVDTKVIDERAFGYFTNLKKAVLPDGLREIRKDAFYSCGNLAEIVGAENVPVIAEDALTATAYYRTCPVIFRGTALLKYNDASARRCEVPDGTTEIAADAFSIRGNDDALEEVVIPDSVTAIGPNAFSGRAKLKTVRLPSGLKKLESGTFRGCAALETLCIPAGVSEIAADAFPEYAEESWNTPEVVPALREIAVAEENPFFASVSGVLYSKDGARLIRVPPIGAEEFTVPQAVTAIGDAAFRGSQILKRVQMTDRVAEIGHGAFDRCKKLEAIDLTHVKRIGSDAFQFCGSLRAVTLSAEKIGDDAFLDCGQLSAVELTGTKIVGDGAFRGCEMLREIRLPDGLEKIGAFAFANCGLQAVTIPKSVRETGSQSFQWCPEITVYDTIDPDAEPCERHLDEYRGTPNSKVGVINSAPCEIVVRSAETDEIKYKVWMNAYAKPGKYSCMLQSSWGRNATFHFAALDRVFPEIQGADEKRRVALNRLRWPVDLAESQRDTYVAYLARSAKDLIRDCIDRDDMETLLFCEPFGVIKKTNIGEMLEYASGKSAAAFTAYLMDYQNRNFSGGRKRAPAFSLKVEEPWTVSRSAPGKVGRYKGTDAELEFPTEVKGEKITGVADTTSKVPENYLAIRSVVLPEGYRAIGDYAFCGCENLETVVLPGTLCSIGRDAFRGCRKLREVILPDSVETLEENAFRGCTSLAQVRFSRNLRKIPGYAFAGCSALKEIELPAGVTMMEKGCFEIFGLQKLTVHCAKMWSEGMCFHNAPTVYAYPGAMNGVYGIARRSIHLLKIVDFPAETEIGLRVSFGADGEETFRFRMEASDAALRKIEVEELDRRLSDAETGAAIADAVRFVYGEPLTSGEANAAEWARLNGLARGEAPAEVAVTEEKRNDDGSASTVYAYRASDRKGTMKAKEIVGQAAGGAAAAEYTDASDERAERSGLWEFSDVETLEFEGKIFVLTGFGAQEESDLTKRIEERGGSVKSSLVVKTDYLIVMEDYDHQTTKYRKAKELQQKGKNVAILSSKQFYDLTAEE